MLLEPPGHTSVLTFHITFEGLTDHSSIVLLLCWPLIHVDSGSGRPGIQHNPILNKKGSERQNRLGLTEDSFPSGPLRTRNTLIHIASHG